MRDLGVTLEMRDIDHDAGRRQELSAGGGKAQVPCLRIEDEPNQISWLYESADIAAYLSRRFAH